MGQSSHSHAIRKTGQTQRKGSKPTAPQQTQNVNFAQTIQRIQRAPQSATPADVLILQRTLGNRAIQQIIQRDDSSEEEEQQPDPRKEAVKKFEGAIKRIEEESLPNLREALTAGDYDTANVIFSQLAEKPAIIAPTSVKTMFQRSLKVLGGMFTGRLPLGVKNTFKLLDISNRYMAVAVELDRLANKYYKIPQLYEVLSSYVEARQNGITPKNQKVQDNL